MPLRSSLEVFVARPWASVALALLCVIISMLSVSDLVPRSTNRTYFPGHQWVFASLSWLLAFLFGYCAVKGLRLRSRSSKT